MRIRTTVTAALAAAAIALTGYVASTASGHDDTQRPITTGCPTANPPAGDHDVVTYNDGWVDGCADVTGDDNRNGRLEPGEAGWTCRHTQLADLPACLKRAYAH